MTRPPQQPPPGLTAIHGQLHVPPRAFPPHSLPGKIQKAIEALTVQNRHLHYGFAQASTWGGHVAKEPLGKYVTRNYGKEKNNLVFPRNTENLFWAFWKGLYCGYSFFFGICLSSLPFTGLWTPPMMGTCLTHTCEAVTSVTSGMSQTLSELREWKWRNGVLGTEAKTPMWWKDYPWQDIGSSWSPKYCYLLLPLRNTN